MLKWDKKREEYYEEIIKSFLSKDFIKKYEKAYRLHDWYLKSIYLANSGAQIDEYSKRPLSTIQLRFCKFSDEIPDLLLTYVNVSEFNVSHICNDDASPLAPTGFDCCLMNIFTKLDEKRFKHEYEFLTETTMSIVAERIKCRIIQKDLPVLSWGKGIV